MKSIYWGLLLVSVAFVTFFVTIDVAYKRGYHDAEVEAVKAIVEVRDKGLEGMRAVRDACIDALQPPAE